MVQTRTPVFDTPPSKVQSYRDAQFTSILDRIDKLEGRLDKLEKSKSESSQQKATRTTKITEPKQ